MSKQLEQFKKANQAYKLKLAQKAGFKTAQDYLNSLNGVIKPPVVTNRSKPKVKPTIHVVDILDASGSMQGGKYTNSCAGIRSSLEDLRGNKDVNYTYTLVEFVQKNKVITPNFLSEVPKTVSFNGADGRDTPLYNTVYTTLNRMNSAVGKDSKVLIKVYTDGGDNGFPGFEKLCANLINKLEKENFTITFVATKADMPKIKADLSLEETNTLAVDNTSQGFARAFTESRGATMMYTASVVKGKDVSKGFYKKVGTLA